MFRTFSVLLSKVTNNRLLFSALTLLTLTEVLRGVGLCRRTLGLYLD